MNDKTFEPDWLSAPGGTILDVIEERGMSSKDLAGLLGYSVERTEKLISGREAITRDVATLLAKRVGGSEKFWLSREILYRNEVARLQSSGNLPAAKAWLDELPLKDMHKLGWITDDQFWFTFFHEAGHLLMHSHKAVFLEDGSDVSLKEEHEANL